MRGGKLSSWSANRVVVPLARANADRLLTTLADAPLSTRELNDWFEHYQKASRGSRERMLSHPRLFLDALRENDEQREGLRLRNGPEGECAADLRCIEAVPARLRKRVPALRPLRLTPMAAAPRQRAAIDALINEIRREGAHDPGRQSVTRCTPCRHRGTAGARSAACLPCRINRAAHPASASRTVDQAAPATR